MASSKLSCLLFDSNDSLIQKGEILIPDINQFQSIYQYDVNRMRQMTSNLYAGGQTTMVIDVLRQTVQDTIDRGGSFFFGDSLPRVESILSRGMASVDLIPKDNRSEGAIDRSFQHHPEHARPVIPTRQVPRERYQGLAKDSLLALSDFVIKRTSVLDYLIQVWQHSDDMYYANATERHGRPDLGLDSKMEASIGSLDRQQIRLDIETLAQRAPRLLNEGMKRAVDDEHHFVRKDELLTRLGNYIGHHPDRVKDQMGHLKRQDSLIYDNEDGDMNARPLDNRQWHDLLGSIIQAALPAI